MIKNIFTFILFVFPAILYSVSYPDIFYQTSLPSVQIGVIRNFDDNQVRVLHENAETGSMITPAAVHPVSGKYAFWVSGASFENFEFGEPGRRLVFGSVSKGTLGWTVCATNYAGKDYTESRPRFSQDGSRVYSTSFFRFNTFINAYDLQTGASEPVFFNRWPRVYNKGITSAALSRDEKTVVFSVPRYRKIDLNTLPVSAGQNVQPSLVLSLREVPYDLYEGKDFILYKTFRELRYRKRKTVLHLYDFKIVEHYELFEYPDTASGSPEPASRDCVLDEKNRFVYTAVRTPDKNLLYRISLKTLKVDPILANVLRVYDITRDGRYLLYTKYRDEAELTSKNAPVDGKPVIAVYDLQTREVKEMSVEGAAGYDTLSFVYRE